MSTDFSSPNNRQQALNVLVRDSLWAVLAGVAVLHLVFVAVELAFPSGDVSRRETIWFALLAIGLGGLAWGLKRFRFDERWAHPLFALAALSVQAHVLDDMRFVGAARSGTDICLMILGIGCFILSRRWFYALTLTTFASWAIACGALFSPAEWRPMVQPLLGALTLSVLVHEVRLITYTTFAEMRARDQRRTDQLKTTMADLEENERALKKQNQLMHGIVRNLPVIAYRIDENGVLTESIGKGLESYGVQDGELVGTNVLENLPQHRRSIEKALGGGTTHYHVEGIGPAGFWAYETFMTFDQSVGFGALGFGIDTTSRRLAEISQHRRRDLDRLMTDVSARLVKAELSQVDVQIRAALSEFAAALGVSCGCICLWRPKEASPPQYVTWHAAAAADEPDLFAEGDLSIPFLVWDSLGNGGLKKEFLCSPDDISDYLRQELDARGIRAFLATPAGADAVYQGFVAFAGKASGSMTAEDHGILQVLGDVCLNVLGRKEALEMLQDSETRLQQVMNNSPAVIFIKDREGRYLFVNRRHEAIFHHPNAELRGLDDFAFLPEENALAVRENDRLVLTTEQPLVRQEIVPHDDGPHSYIVVKFPLRDAYDRVYALCGIATDITDQKKAEEKVRVLNAQLEQVSRVGGLGEMAAGIAHELHQPLEVMVNFARGAVRRLDKQKFSHAESRECFQSIADQALRAGKVIDHVLEFVRKRELQLQPTVIRKVIDDALSLARFTLEKHAVDLEVFCDSNLPPIMADGVQLSQVLINLLINAAQALGEARESERRVRIDARRCHDGSVEVIITDNGPGLADTIQEHLFEQFFTTRRDGLGLGLAMSRSIVESHAGELWVRSVKGQGCDFHIVLPASTPIATLQEEELPDPEFDWQGEDSVELTIQPIIDRPNPE